MAQAQTPNLVSLLSSSRTYKVRTSRVSNTDKTMVNMDNNNSNNNNTIKDSKIKHKQIMVAMVDNNSSEDSSSSNIIPSKYKLILLQVHSNSGILLLNQAQLHKTLLLNPMQARQQILQHLTLKLHQLHLCQKVKLWRQRNSSQHLAQKKLARNQPRAKQPHRRLLNRLIHHLTSPLLILHLANQKNSFY